MRERLRSRWPVVLVCVAVAWVPSGCGSDHPVGAVNVAESYLHDLGDGRYSDACALLTDQLRQRLGDCARKVRQVAEALPVGERDELRYVRVRQATYHGDTAQVHPADVTTDATPAPKASGKAGKSKTIRSIAANHALDGQPLTLQKTGDTWLISDGAFVM